MNVNKSLNQDYIKKTNYQTIYAGDVALEM